ncbi:MAG: hypothetical protein AAFQ82_23035, partial [Myxococcota bacterium]
QPGACECAFPDATSQAGPGGTCTDDAECALSCADFEAPNCPPGCEESAGVCANADGSTGPQPEFQPRVCDQNQACEAFATGDCPEGCVDNGSACISPSLGSCVCNFAGFYCDPNTPIGCDCRARPF